MKVSLDTDKLDIYVEKGKDWVLSPELEENYIKLNQIVEEATQAREALKERMIANCRKKFGNQMKIFESDRLRVNVSNRASRSWSGALNEDQLSLSRIAPDAKKVEAYIQAHGENPPGLKVAYTPTVRVTIRSQKNEANN